MHSIFHLTRLVLAVRKAPGSAFGLHLPGQCPNILCILLGDGKSVLYRVLCKVKSALDAWSGRPRRSITSMEQSTRSAADSLAFKDVTAHYNDAKDRASQDDEMQDTNRTKEIQFKASHTVLIFFFLWILYVSPQQAWGPC